MAEIIKSEGQCLSCGETAILGNGYCDKCWDKVERRRQRLLAKGVSQVPPPAETTSKSQDIYYVMRNSELVEATVDEFLAVIAGGRYYK